MIKTNIIHCLPQVSELLDKFDNIMEAFTEDIEAAVTLSKVGNDLILEQEFARDSLEPKCTQLRIMCKTQEILFLERRQTLLKGLDLFEGLDSLSKWCSTTTQHLNMDLDMDRDTDILSQIRQCDYLLSKARGKLVNKARNKLVLTSTEIPGNFGYRQSSSQSYFAQFKTFASLQIKFQLVRNDVFLYPVYTFRNENKIKGRL